MESGKSTEDLTPKMSSNNSIHLVLVVISLVVAIVALLVACVGISLKGTTNLIMQEHEVNSAQASQSGHTHSSQSSSDDKIWSIAIGHSPHKEAYIDEETGMLKGFMIDFTNAVCRLGNKNCRIVNDVFNHCWDSEQGQVARGGLGLMSGWYDACAGWVGTVDRYRTFAFADAFGKIEPESLFVKPGSPLAGTWRNMENKKIGIVDGWWTDESCLNRNTDAFTSGAPFDSNLIVHYSEVTDLVDAVMNGVVDYAFQSTVGYTATQLERVDGDPVLPCAQQGAGHMTQKVNQEFLNWWNEAQKRLMESSEYAEICKDLDEEHGHMPGLGAEAFCFL